MKPPTDRQQDYILYAILRELNGQSQDAIAEWIFPKIPDIPADQFQSLLRFLGGMEDFGRVNCHQPRWTKIERGMMIGGFASLRECAPLKRVCLFCYGYKRYKNTDSEWHSVLVCPYMTRPRRKFKLALSEKGHGAILGENWGLKDDGNAVIPDVKDLAELVNKCRMHPELVSELARFVSAILARRKRLYQYWLARGSSGFPTPHLKV